jgi:hypothetical protein
VVRDPVDLPGDAVCLIALVSGISDLDGCCSGCEGARQAARNAYEKVFSGETFELDFQPLAVENLAATAHFHCCGVAGGDGVKNSAPSAFHGNGIVLGAYYNA